MFDFLVGCPVTADTTELDRLLRSVTETGKLTTKYTNILRI